MSKKNNEDFDWEDSIDKEISDEDKLKHKEVAKKVVKAAKIKKIAFWSATAVALSAVLITTIVVITMKPRFLLTYWYNSVPQVIYEEYDDSKYGIIIKKENIQLDGNPEQIMTQLTNENDDLKKSKVLKDYIKFSDDKHNYSVQANNFIIDSITKKRLYVDLAFRKNRSQKVEFVIKNFPINTKYETVKFNESALKSKKQEFSKKFLEDIKSKIVFNLFLPIDITKNPPKDKVIEYKSQLKNFIDEFNQKQKTGNYDPISLSWTLTKDIPINKGTKSIKLLPNIDTNSNFFFPLMLMSEIILENFDTEKWIDNSKLKFKARLLTLSLNTERLGKYRAEYGIYIEPSDQEFEFSVPLKFKVSKN
ncbi:hypothetical protein OF364_01265 [Mycoplasma enhydrae]|uniref:hypothetical protein n=1 Tax=Mycoplasma enhydrae TaxID=2499220 RepID=UPI0021E7F659|nr:hypothetical protein [Mycoplasma enhydrae]MCV3733581.1 hypothetical protein [Mycoplasma enhydrae]MCV3753443.1 hypothetical protein [Mycoplasma enhydrae]